MRAPLPAFAKPLVAACLLAGLGPATAVAARPARPPVSPSVSDFLKATGELPDKSRRVLEEALKLLKDDPRESGRYDDLYKAVAHDEAARSKVRIAARRYDHPDQARHLKADLVAIAREAAAARSPAPTRPPQGGVDPDADPGIAGFVSRSGQFLKDPKTGEPSPQRGEFVARVLAGVQAGRGPEAAAAVIRKLSETGQAGFDALFREADKFTGADKIAKTAGAVLELASRPAGPGNPLGGALAAPPQAGRAGGQPPAGPIEGAPVEPGARKGKGRTAEQNPANLLKALLDKDDGAKTRKKDAAKRLIAFLWDRDGIKDGKSFVDAKLTSEDEKLPPEQRMRLRVEAVVLKWAELRTADAAKIYYFIGMGGEVPKWVADAEQELERDHPDQPKPLTGGGRFKPKMLEALDRWTAPSSRGFEIPAEQALDGKPRVIVIGPLGGTNVPDGWVNAFLADASAAADKVWRASLQDPDRVRREIERNRDLPQVPSGPGRRPGSGAARGYGFVDNFGQWGDPDVFYLDGRLLSIRVVAAREGDRLVSKVAIFDISNPSDIYGKVFGLDFQYDQPFALDERTPGHKLYNLQFVPKGDDIKVVFKRPDGAEAKNMAGESGTTVNALFRLRALRALERNEVVKIGGTEFLVVPQSAGQGCYQFLPTGISDRIAASPRSITTELLGCTSGIANGETVRLPGKQPLGPVGDKYYYLVYDRERAVWFHQEGAPPPPQQPSQPPGHSHPGGGDSGRPGAGPSRPGEGGGQVPPGGGGQREDGWPDLSGVGYSPDASEEVRNLNAKLAPGVNARLYLNPNEPDPASKWIVVYKRAEPNNVYLNFYGQAWTQIRRVDVLDGTLLAAGNELGDVYYDLSKDLISRGRGPDGRMLAELYHAGTFDPAAAQNNLSNVRDLNVLKDILAKPEAAFSPVEQKAVLELAEEVRTQGAAKDRFKPYGPEEDVPPPEAYSIAGTIKPDKLLYMNLGARRLRLFPKPGFAAIPEESRPRPGDEGLAGGGTAFDQEVDLGPFDRFAPEVLVDGKPKRLSAQKDGAALYEGESEAVVNGAKATRKEWYVEITVKLKGESKPGMVSPPILVFNDPAQGRTLPPADMKSVQIAGLDLPLQKLVGINTVRVEPVAEYFRGLKTGERPAKGAVAVYDGPAGRKTHCVGVVLWWGLGPDGRQAALAQCRKK